MISAETIIRQVLHPLRVRETLAHYGKAILANVAIAFVLMALGLLLVIFAVAYASWSGYVAAEPAMGAAKASLIVAIILVLVAGLFFYVGWRFVSRDPKPKHAKEVAGATAAGGLPVSVEDAETIIRVLKDRVEDDPIAATIVSLCSGYVAGAVLFNKKS